MRYLSDRILKRIITILVVLALYFLFQAFYIPAKAMVAQMLLQSAWKSTLAGKDRVRPWPWADTWPVARLRIPELNVDQIILHGDHGSSLAFAPGQRVYNFQEEKTGVTLISAHRDTHFRFLLNISLGQKIELHNEFGEIRHFKVEDIQVLDSTRYGIEPPQKGHWLTLVTCYPFNAIDNRGSLRYVVFAEEIDTCPGLSCSI